MRPAITEPVPPLDTFVVKVASRCNLNCDYCYVYHSGDMSYREQPRRMPKHVVAALASRLREHILATRLPAVSIIIHGGEPLLAGPQFFREFVGAIREALPPDASASFGLQTNGTLLTEDWADLLCNLGIRIGISLDGPAEVNDLHRVDHAQRSSHLRTEHAVRLMLGTDLRLQHFSGILSVIDPTTDPVVVFDYFRTLGIDAVDFLLPDATYEKSPPVSPDSKLYGDWLAALFDCWIEQRNPHVRVRFFETIVELLLGAGRSVDYIGGKPTRNAVIETDGGIEPVDVLKICRDRFTKLGLNVLHNSLLSVCSHWLGAAYAAGNPAPCAICRSCSVLDVCGGGYMPHRYSAAHGFDNPSVYCYALKRLILRIDQRLAQSIPNYPPRDVSHIVAPSPSAQQFFYSTGHS